MDSLTEQRLNELNRTFYREFANSFAETRSEPQPGFYEIEKYLHSANKTMLDVGCGEGRLGRFLMVRGSIETYDGVDGSEELIEIAKSGLSGQFWHRDLMDPNALGGIGQYGNIACLAVLQHIPGRSNRVRLVAEMGEHLASGGRMLISTWQFLTSERQKRKIADWREAGLDPALLETHDYLLTWRRDGKGLRYANYIDENELRALAHEAGLRTVVTFRSDGRERNLNLYAVCEPDREIDRATVKRVVYRLGEDGPAG